MNAHNGTARAVDGNRVPFIGRIGLGSAQLGNLYRSISDEQAGAIVDAAWDSGVRYFDVAPHYGLGLAEERLGMALRRRPRDEYVVSTKVGRLLIPNENSGGLRDDDLFDVPARFTRRIDYSRDGVLRSIDESLNRLGLDRIDIVYVHDPDEHYRETLEGAFPALDELRQQGTISAYGAGMNQARMLADFIRNTDANAMMLAGRYTLLDQSARDELLPLARDRHVAIAAAGVFNSGILAIPHPTAGSRLNYVSAPSDMVDRALRIAAICERHGVTLPVAAAHFPLTNRAVQTVVLGADTPEQAEENARILELEIPNELWLELELAGLIQYDNTME